MSTLPTAERWDELVLQTKHQSFLQSWAWREFVEETGATIESLVVQEGSDVVAASHVIRRQLPFNWHWLYAPFAPIVRTATAGEQLREKLQEHARESGAVFVRLEPADDLPKSKWRASTHVQPQYTAVLDLSSDEDTILATMHTKTRYNIRLAERKGVAVRFSRDQRDIDTFLAIGEEMTARTGFHLHPPLYYHQMLETLGAKDMLDVVVAEYKGKPLAALILIHFGRTTYYVHGASRAEHRSVMAPHAAHWEALKRVKEQGRTAYDFWGVAPEGASSTHPWSGITRFKLGFGAERRSYPGAVDWVAKPGLYQLYRLAKRRVHS